jgi:glycosyl transferase family 87
LYPVGPGVPGRLTAVADRLARLESRWLWPGLLLVFALGFPLWVRRPGDFAGYLIVGDLVLAGRHIYADAPPHINTWPPFFSLLCVPLALLAAPTPYLARGVWLVLNAALLAVVLRLISRLVYRDGRPELLIPLLLSARFVLGNFEHLQINLVVFALALTGLALQARGREVTGGVVLGFAAAIKVMPLAFVPYLMYRGRWRAAATTLAATAAFSASPLLVFGWDRFRDYLTAWRAAVAAGWGAGRMNQSVLAMWDRLLAHRLWPLTAPGVDDLPESGAALTRLAVAVSLAVVIGLALAAFRGRPRPDGWAALAEWSAVFVVAAVFGPVSWKSYLVVSLLPNTLLFAVWRSAALDGRTRAVGGRVLLAVFLLGGLTAPGLVGRAAAERLEMSSVVTLAALVLLGGVLWLRPRLPLAEKGAPSGSQCRSNMDTLK